MSLRTTLTTFGRAVVSPVLCWGAANSYTFPDWALLVLRPEGPRGVPCCALEERPQLSRERR